MRDRLLTLGRRALDVALVLAISPACAACRRPLERPSAGPVCAACWASIRAPSPPLCRACGIALASWRTVSVALERCARCRRTAPAVDRARAAGEYQGTLRDIVHAFKYEGRRTLARRLGVLMRQAGVELIADATCAVPVPLHHWRRIRRGFNQASDLAAALPLPLLPALWRIRSTASQTGLSAAARRKNVGGAFRLSPILSAKDVQRLQDAIVVLVDDVRTTGATLDACGRVLKAAGVREVRALTAAQAAPPGSEPGHQR
jgi:ComF family protein